MRTINGFKIVARKAVRDGFIILGVRDHMTAPDGFEYVVAFIDRIGAHCWSTGDYTHNFGTAVETFERRA